MGKKVRRRLKKSDIAITTFDGEDYLVLEGETIAQRGWFPVEPGYEVSESEGPNGGREIIIKRYGLPIHECELLTLYQWPPS